MAVHRNSEGGGFRLVTANFCARPAPKNPRAGAGPAAHDDSIAQTSLTGAVAQRKPTGRQAKAKGQSRAALAPRRTPAKAARPKPRKAAPKRAAKKAAAPARAGPAPKRPKQSSPARAFVNARVLAMGPPRDGKPGWEIEHQAILWQGDTVVAVGSDEDVRAKAKQLGAKTEDLEGRVVLPGFVDAHTHFLHVGVKRTRPDLRGAKSLKEALARLAAFLRGHPGGHHVIAEGWDESEWTPGRGEAAPDGKARKPTRQDLDAVIAQAAKDGAGPIDRPVVLRRICGHIAVASSGASPGRPVRKPRAASSSNCCT